MAVPVKLSDCPFDWCERCDDHPDFPDVLHRSADVVLIPRVDPDDLDLVTMVYYSDGDFALSAGFESEGSADEMLKLADQFTAAATTIRDTVARFTS